MIFQLSTEVVAWYGAIVATLVLVFDFWKWRRSRARLRIRITSGVYYLDAVASKDKTAPGSEEIQLTPYFHIEVVNSGELPTTILGVGATTKATSLLGRLWQRKSHLLGSIGIAGSAFHAHYNKYLPHVIGPGEVWSCRIEERSILSLLQGGHPKLELTAACWNDPKLLRFPLPLKATRPILNSTP